MTMEERELRRQQQEAAQTSLDLDLPDPRTAPVKPAVGRNSPATSINAAGLVSKQHRFAMLGAFWRRYLGQLASGTTRDKQDGYTYHEAMVDANMEKESSPEKRIEELRDNFGYLEPVPGLKRKAKRPCQVYRISEKGVKFAETAREDGMPAPAADLTGSRLPMRQDQIEQQIKDDYARLTAGHWEHLPTHRLGCGCDGCAIIRDTRRLFGMTTAEI